MAKKKLDVAKFSPHKTSYHKDVKHDKPYNIKKQIFNNINFSQTYEQRDTCGDMLEEQNMLTSIHKRTVYACTTVV